MSLFKKAERRQVKLKLAITGPSGSGKTYSALRLATGLGNKIALIDTENGSASLYSDKFDFDVLELSAPYTVEKYIQAINAAVSAGYEVLIIDSISHQWRGEGGILNRKEQLDARGGNSFTNWGKLTPEQEKFVSSVLHSNIHLIATIRSKQEYAMAQDEKGKARVQKLGLAPIQREGMEYEFTTVFDVAMNHEAEASKDRTGLFADKMFKITEDTGKELLGWLNSASAAPVKLREPVTPPTYEAPPYDPQNPLEPPRYAVYQIPFGPYRGKKITDLHVTDLRSYYDRIRSDAKARGSIKIQEKEFLDLADDYFEGIDNFTSSMEEDFPK